MVGRRARRSLTVRGWGLAVVGALVGCAGLFGGMLDLLRIGIALAVAAAAAYAWAWRPWPAARVSRDLPDRGMFAGVESRVLVRIVGVGRSAPMFVLAERVDPFLGESIAVPLRDVVDSHGLGRLWYPIHPQRRGAASLGPGILVRADGLGLAQSRQIVLPRDDVTVWPRLRAVADELRLGLDPSSGGAATERSTRRIDDLVPREYRDGDDFRRIHWPATAAHGQLMVRTDEHALTTAGSLHIAIASSPDEETTEEIVSAAASVGVALLAHGHRVTVSVDGSRSEVSSWGPADKIAMLDYLAVAETPGASPAQSLPLRGDGDLIAVVAAATDADLFSELAAASTSMRRVAIVVGPKGRETATALRADGILTIVWDELVSDGAARRAQPAESERVAGERARHDGARVGVGRSS